MAVEAPTLNQMRAFLARKQAHQRIRNEQLWRQAATDAEQIVGMIVSQFDPQAIYQWGSVLYQSHFNSLSDIDIAVEGLNSAERFFALVAEAEKMTRFPLDIVELEQVQPAYVTLIKKFGRCIYQRPNETVPAGDI